MTTKEKPTSIIAFKGFNPDWTCRGYQYSIGKVYVHDRKVEACESGFHACEYPLDVFKYYAPAQSVSAIVEASGDLDRKGNDSKIASSKLTVKEEIGIAGLVKAAIEYTVSRTKPSKSKNSNSDDEHGAASATGYQGAASATGYYGAASATGYQGAASATGYQGAASATGYYGASSATGIRSASSATGYHGAASATGYHGAASATGDYGAASATGYHGAASATGYHGAASATGDHGAASATGNYGAASATGNHGAASATGYQGAASATGYYGAASATGEHSVAMSVGWKGKAMASETGAIVLVYRNMDDKIIHIRASKVGENGIKPDTWYTLNSDGDFIEVSK